MVWVRWLERSGTGEAQGLATFRVGESQVFGVQQQTIRFFACRRIGVERVAENRVAEGLHVHAKLMRATGFRCEFEARTLFSGIVTEYPVEGERGFAHLEIDFMERAVRPVDDERQVDFAGGLSKFPLDNGDIEFAHVSVLKLDAQAAMHFLAARQNEQAGRITVQTMHDQSLRVVGLDAFDQAVLLFCAASGYG